MQLPIMKLLVFLLALLGNPVISRAVVLRTGSPTQLRDHQLEGTAEIELNVLQESNSAFYDNSEIITPAYAEDSKADSEGDFPVINLNLQDELLKLNQVTTDVTQKSPSHVATEIQRTRDGKQKVGRQRTVRAAPTGCWELVKAKRDVEEEITKVRAKLNDAINDNKELKVQLELAKTKIEEVETEKGKEAVKASQELLPALAEEIRHLATKGGTQPSAPFIAAYTSPQPPKISLEASDAPTVTLQQCSRESDVVTENLRSRITALTASKANAEEDLKSTKEALKIAKYKNDQLESDVAALRKDKPVLSEWGVSLAVHKGKISYLEEECAKDLQARDDQIMSLDAMTDDNAKALKIVEDQHEVCTKKLSEIDGRENLIKIEMKATFDDLERKYDELRKEKDDVTREKNDIQAKLNVLENEKVELEKTVTKSAVEKSKMEEEMKNLAEESAGKTSKMVTIDEQWLDLKRNYTKCMSSRGNQQARLSTQNKRQRENV